MIIIRVDSENNMIEITNSKETIYLGNPNDIDEEMLIHIVSNVVEQVCVDHGWEYKGDNDD